MNTIFVVLEIILSIAIIGVVLLQKSSNLGLGVYSGSNDSLFGAKGPAGFLAKMTMFLAILFLANTIFLGYQFNTKHQKSVFDKIDTQDSTTLNKPLDSTPATPLNAPLDNASSLAPLAPQSEQQTK